MFFILHDFTKGAKVKMIEAKDLQPVIVALESISIRGSQDVGTMKNIFDYLVMLQQKANEQLETDDKKEGEA